MQVTIIVDDQLVGVDGHFIHLPNLDWAKFNGDQWNPWDDVHAVQFDGEQGHVEYKEVTTQQSSRPNIKPPDLRLDAAAFKKQFGWVLEEYQKVPTPEPEPIREPIHEPIDETPFSDVVGSDEPANYGVPKSWGQILSDIDRPVDDIPPAPEPMKALTRDQAISAIKEMANNLTAISPRDQSRYELAVQARNGSTYAMSLFQDEAKMRGLSVSDLANAVIAQRGEYEKLIMRVAALETRLTAEMANIAEEDVPYAVDAAISELKKGAGHEAMDRGGA